MQDRRQQILEEAIGLFTQYGVRRTTMHDIAEASHISRQTLYTLYPNKSAIFQAIIELHRTETLAALDAFLQSEKPLSEGLDVIFYHLAIVPFQKLKDTPHGDEILEGMDMAAGDDMADLYTEFRAAVTKMLIQKTKLQPDDAINAEQFADLIVTSTTAFKHKANTLEHLSQLLNNQKLICLSFIDNLS